MLDRLDYDASKEADPQLREEELMKRFGWEEQYWQGERTRWMRLKPKVWALFDEPYSSPWAKVTKNPLPSLFRLSTRAKAE